MSEFENWLQDAIYYMMMAKLNESLPVGKVHKSGLGLFKVMRHNHLDFRGMFECGIESYDVPDCVREEGSMFITPKQ